YDDKPESHMQRSPRKRLTNDCGWKHDSVVHPNPGNQPEPQNQALWNISKINFDYRLTVLLMEAGAHVDHGVMVVVGGEHLSRTAGRSCHVAVCWALSFFVFCEFSC